MVSLGRFALGAGELAVVFVAAGLGAAAVRTRYVPQWRGLVARIADAVLALAVITVVEQALGTFGLLREWIVVVVVAVAAIGVGLRVGLSTPAPEERAVGAITASTWRRVSVVGAVAAVAVTVGQWADRIGSVLDGGITSYDSIHYHLPFAARFAQTGSTAHIQLITPEFPDAYHHANAELLHALGMLMFHRDVLSVFLNLGFVALALVAAYCIGERWSEGPLAVIGLCVVLASPLMGLHHAGAATNDIVVLAFVLCAAALLLATNGEVAGFGFVGLAAGMAFGTKLTVAVVAATIVLAVAFLAPRGKRLAATLTAALCAAAPSAYWLVRDFVDTGNPAPGVKIPFFTTDNFQTLDDLGYSVAHYATSTAVWRDWFFPGLRIDLGRAWPLALAAAVVGSVFAITSGDQRARVVGVVAALGGLFYVLTPSTALGPDGRPLLFASNVRYAAPVLALGLVLLPSHSVVRRRPVQWVTGAVLAAAFVVSQFARGPFPAWPAPHRSLGYVVAGGIAVAVIVYRRVPRATGAALALVVLAGAYPIAHRYDVRRYATDPVARWADSVHGARIAVAGFGPQFDLFGRDFSNRVQYVGVRGPHGGFHEIVSCAEWRRALQEGRYDYVVVAPQFPGAAARVVPWTASDPTASVVVTGGNRTVYRLRRAAETPAC